MNIFYSTITIAEPIRRVKFVSGRLYFTSQLHRLRNQFLSVYLNVILYILAQSDQAGENDGVYKAFIKYIAHLGRRAKRKIIVVYHQWNEKRNAAKKAAALMEEAMMQQQDVDKQIQLQNQMERDGFIEQKQQTQKTHPPKKKHKKRRKRRRRRPIRELIEDEHQNLSEMTSVATTVRKQSLPLPPMKESHKIERRMSCLSPMFNVNLNSPVPPKASPEISEIDSQDPFRPSAPKTVSSESVFIHPTPSIFSPPRNRSRESSISYYTAVEEPSLALASSNHRRDTRDSSSAPPPIIWDNAAGTYLVLQKKGHTFRGQNRLDSSKTTTSDNNKVVGKNFGRSAKKFDKEEDDHDDLDSKDQVQYNLQLFQQPVVLLPSRSNYFSLSKLIG